MNKSISVSINLANSSSIDHCENVNPKKAIDTYFSPDTYPPVTSVHITATDENGKTLFLSITPDSVVFRIE